MSDFWSKNFNTQPQRPNTPAPAPNYPPQQYVQPQNYPPVQQQVPLSPTCPECRSVNYAVAAKQITSNGQVESWRCYDCGYPIVQSGSKLGGASSAPSAGPAQRATQVETGGWNPTTIIGKLD